MALSYSDWWSQQYANDPEAFFGQGQDRYNEYLSTGVTPSAPTTVSFDPLENYGGSFTPPINPYAEQIAAYNQANPLSQYGIQGDWQRVSDISYGPGAMYNPEAQRYDPTLGWMTPQQNINFSYGKSPDLAAQIFQGAIMSAIAAMTG